jgi:hypothetical protein
MAAYKQVFGDPPFSGIRMAAVYITSMLLITTQQFWRWIDPLGQYFCFNLKNANEAKDISSWALRTIRSNAEGLFTNADDTARDVSRVVLSSFIYYLSYLLQAGPLRPQQYRRVYSV